LIIDFDTQVCRFLVQRNFGDVPYTVTPKKLNEEGTEVEMPQPLNAPTPPDLSKPEAPAPPKDVAMAA